MKSVVGGGISEAHDIYIYIHTNKYKSQILLPTLPYMLSALLFRWLGLYIKARQGKGFFFFQKDHFCVPTHLYLPLSTTLPTPVRKEGEHCSAED